MTSQELLQKDIPLISPDDLVSYAFNVMEDFKVEHLPVGENGNYLGLVSEDDLLELDEETNVKRGSSKLIRCFAESGQHIVEAFRLFSQYNVSLLPVLDAEGNYLGCLLPQDMVMAMGDSLSFSHEGGIVVLKIHDKDFQMSQIAQIVESDDAKILASWVSASEPPGELEVAIKINKKDLSRILQTFSRYDYSVLASFHESDHASDIKHRYEAFMKYLNM
jgi:CBS domain-containing protein